MPQRRCVGCGRIAPKPELLRFVADRGRDARTRAAVIDRAGTLPGRGAYLCREPGSDGVVSGCLTGATRRGGIQRALRAPVTFDPKLVESVSR